MRTQEYFKYEITLKRKKLFTEIFSQELSIKRKIIKKHNQDPELKQCINSVNLSKRKRQKQITKQITLRLERAPVSLRGKGSRVDPEEAPSPEPEAVPNSADAALATAPAPADRAAPPAATRPPAFAVAAAPTAAPALYKEKK